jgi:hypothetical protein
METKKQTAVEWLHCELDELEMFKNKRSLTLHLDLRAELFQQAKAMEKEQIIDACNYGDFEELGEQYYNETYGK